MGKTFNMVGGGANVVANPAMTGTEIDLQGLEVNGTKYKVPLIRPNLLINSYFVGGGSQQGGGRFPVNQKGQTSYSTNNAVAIDCWKMRTEDGNLAIGSAGITKSRTDATKFGGVVQGIENGVSSLAGKTVTFSVLISAISVDKSWLAITNGSQIQYVGTTIAIKACESVGLHTLTTVIPENLTNAMLNFWITQCNASDTIIPAGTGSVTIAAAKVEIGDTQTLARNEGTEENPVWVLNEIPNYTEELWKCQRYYQLFASSSYRPTYGENYRPPMRLHSPSKGTISIGGTTYYYADANL